MKKVRGWKRRVRQLERWTKDNLKFDTGLLYDIGYDYIKLFSLPEGDVPNWYKKIVANNLYEVFTSWDRQAQKELDNKFLLSLIISEKDIMQSQVLIAIDDRIDFYLEQRKFSKEDNRRPNWLFNEDWQPYLSCIPLLEEELEECDLLNLRIVDKKQVIDYEGNNTFEYLIEDGVFWTLNSQRT
ncbi:hypothetical protein [Bacillus sp. FJAT-47783]|uniref:hypothetical protein n=1 Tax=Bacillus sp. FJAT-47783 TaxID=2922712 RepID=UPI001FAD11FC|nr:hypothetical protein [Bacillus sp. FJAT-47783]